MIKVTLITIQNAITSFQKLAESKLPIKAAFKVAKMIKLVSSEMDAYETQRVAAIKQLGTEKEDGSFQVEGDAVPLFHAEIIGLLELVVELQIDTLSLSELGDIPLTAQDMIALEAFIEDK